MSRRRRYALRTLSWSLLVFLSAADTPDLLAAEHMWAWDAPQQTGVDTLDVFAAEYMWARDAPQQAGADALDYSAAKHMSAKQPFVVPATGLTNYAAPAQAAPVLVALFALELDLLLNSRRLNSKAQCR